MKILDKLIIEGFAARPNQVDKLSDIFSNKCLREAKMNAKAGDPLYNGYPADDNVAGKILDIKNIHNMGIYVKAELTHAGLINKIQNSIGLVIRPGGSTDKTSFINKVRVIQEMEITSFGIIPDENNEQPEDQVDIIAKE